MDDELKQTHTNNNLTGSHVTKIFTLYMQSLGMFINNKTYWHLSR